MNPAPLELLIARAIILWPELVRQGLVRLRPPGDGRELVCATSAWLPRGLTRSSTAERGRLSSLFSHGQKDWYLGGHPVWELFRVAYKMSRRPYVLGGAALGLGYLSACARRIERPVSNDLVRFHRQEQGVVGNEVRRSGDDALLSGVHEVDDKPLIVGLRIAWSARQDLAGYGAGIFRLGKQALVRQDRLLFEVTVP